MRGQINFMLRILQRPIIIGSVPGGKNIETTVNNGARWKLEIEIITVSAELFRLGQSMVKFLKTMRAVSYISTPGQSDVKFNVEPCPSIIISLAEFNSNYHGTKFGPELSVQLIAGKL